MWKEREGCEYEERTCRKGNKQGLVIVLRCLAWTNCYIQLWIITWESLSLGLGYATKESFVTMVCNMFQLWRITSVARLFLCYGEMWRFGCDEGLGHLLLESLSQIWNPTYAQHISLTLFHLYLIFECPNCWINPRNMNTRGSTIVS
jgi:hypothetical protein